METCWPDLSHFKYYSKFNWDEPQLTILSYMITKLSYLIWLQSYLGRWVEGSSLPIFKIPASWHIGPSISLTSRETKCTGIA